MWCRDDNILATSDFRFEAIFQLKYFILNAETIANITLFVAVNFPMQLLYLPIIMPYYLSRASSPAKVHKCSQ